MAETYVKDGMEAGNVLMKGSEGKPGFDAASEDISKLLTAFRDQQLKESTQDMTDNMRSAKGILIAMLWGGLAATLLSVASGAIIVRAILGQLGCDPSVAASLVQRIGEGDLSSRIELQAINPHSLLASVEAMQQGLRRVVTTVREMATGVEKASVGIESGNNELSSRTASQASSLQETAASMEQLNATVMQNVVSARQASELANVASASATQGGEIVGQVVSTMEGINESSRRISDIISVIAHFGERDR